MLAAALAAAAVVLAAGLSVPAVALAAALAVPQLSRRDSCATAVVGAVGVWQLPSRAMVPLSGRPMGWVIQRILLGAYLRHPFREATAVYSAARRRT